MITIGGKNFTTEIIEKIGEFLTILGDHLRLMQVIREELVEVLTEYGDARRSEIISSKRDLRASFSAWNELISELDATSCCSRVDA